LAVGRMNGILQVTGISFKNYFIFHSFG